MTSLAVLARLFPNPNSQVHLLLNSLISLMAAAKSGRADHILLSKTGPILGTKRGLGHSHVGGFAISAVRLLVDTEAYKPTPARRAVAQMLTELGFSNRVGEYDLPKPVTEYAVRNWVEKAQNFPQMHDTAAAMSGIHAINLERQRLGKDDLFAPRIGREAERDRPGDADVMDLSDEPRPVSLSERGRGLEVNEEITAINGGPIAAESA